MSRYNLSGLAIRMPGLTWYLIAMLLVLGFAGYKNLGQTDMPTWTLRIMVLQVQWPGATAAEMEQQVVDKIERKLQETPWLDNLSSFSRPGEGYIFFALRLDTPDMATTSKEIWYQVRKRVGDMRFQLPEGVIGPFFNDEFGDVFPLVYTLSGDDFDYAELEDQADIIRQELLRLPTVDKVNLLGVQPEKIYIEFSRDRLANMNIDTQILVDTIRQQNSVIPGGEVHGTQQRVWLRMEGGYQNAEEVADTLITDGEGQLIRLGDIANVRRGFEDPPVSTMRYMGKPAVGLAVSMASGYSVLDLGSEAETLIDQLGNTLPLGMDLTLVADQPQIVSRTMRLFLQKLAIAIAIVLAVSYFTLGLRSGLVVATAFPLVLGTTFMLMSVWDIDLQRISLGALIISLGLLVDDAIIITEMMLVKMEQGIGRFEAAQAAYQSTSFPMLTGTLVSIAGFLPLAIAESNMREFMFAFYTVLAIALMVSWIVSVLFTPFIAYYLLPASIHKVDQDDVYQTPFYRRLRAVIKATLAHPWLVLLFTALLMAAGVMAARTVEKQFFPLTERPELIIESWLPEGSSYAETEAFVDRLDELLADEPLADTWISYIGTDTPRIFTDLNIEQPTPNMTKTYVAAASGKEREILRWRLQSLLAEELPQARSRINIFSFGPPVGAPVQYRVMGYDLDRVREYAAQVRVAVDAHPQTRDTHLNWRGSIKTVNIKLDQGKIRRLGLSTEKLKHNLDVLVSGLPVTQLRDGDDAIDVVIRLQEDQRDQISTLNSLPIRLPNNQTVTLDQVATLELAVEDGIRWRYDRFPTVTVNTYMPWTIQPHSIVADLQGKIDEIRATMPFGYHIEEGGNVETNRDTDALIAPTLPIVLLVIVTLLMVQLRHFGLTLLVVATAPIGFAGATITLLLAGQPLGFAGQVGILALAGIIMRNSVILVDQIRQDLEAGLDRWDAILESTVRRFRPITVTGIAAVLAMGPLTTDPFWGPMAWAMMGGLTVATLLTSFLVPALYAIFFRVKAPAEAK